MKLYAAAMLCLLALAAIPSCAHVTPVASDCSKDLSADAMTAVERALIDDDYEVALAQLAGKFGECVIRAGVQSVVDRSKRDGAARTDALGRVRIERATSWISAHPAKT